MQDFCFEVSELNISIQNRGLEKESARLHVRDPCVREFDSRYLEAAQPLLPGACGAPQQSFVPYQSHINFHHTGICMKINRQPGKQPR